MRAFRLLLFVAVLAVSGWLAAGQAAAKQVPPHPRSTTFSGLLTTLWFDNLETQEEGQRFFLHTSAGEEIELHAAKASAAELLALNGQRVLVEGRALSESPASGSGLTAPPVAVDAVQLEDANTALPEQQPITGNTRWVTILCKYADHPEEPYPPSFFQDLFANSYPGLDHYWREASYGQMNLADSTVAGWYTLPLSREAYLANEGSIQKDCVEAADPDVYFPDNYGFILVFNDVYNGFAWAGTRWLSNDNNGVERPYGYVVLPLDVAFDQSVLQHEMGHAYKMPHSLAGTNPYGNPWDVVSSNRYGCGSIYDPDFACVGQHTIAYNRYRNGWIPPERVYVAEDGENHSFTLERATQPGAEGYLMAIVPDLGGFYTIEARQQVGYDSKLPGSAVIIHEFRYYEPVKLVDPSLYNYGDGQSAMWLPGEGFGRHRNTFPTHAFLIRVDAATPTGFKVSVWRRDVREYTTTLPVNADTTIREDQPNTNFGSATTLELSPSPRSWVILGFDDEKLPPAVTRLTLWMYVPAAYGTTAYAYTQPADSPCWRGSTWEETTLTWNSLTAGNCPNYNLDYAELGRTEQNEEYWVTSDLTAYGAKNGVSKIMVMNSLAPMILGSKEGHGAAVLQVNHLIAYDEFPCSTTPANLLTNPSFEDGIRPWKFYSDVGGSFTTDPDSAYECAWGGRVDFDGSGKNQQLYQTGFPLTAGARYRLSFLARSTDGRDLQVYIQRHTSPYTNYGLGQLVPLWPGWTIHNLEFTAGGFSGTSTDTRLRFWFAGLAQGGDVYEIDQVRLEEVGAVPPTPTNTPAPPTPALTPTSTPVGPTPTSTATPTATPISGGDCSVFPANVISNPSFEDGTRPWKFYSDAGGSFRTDAGSAFECAWGGRAAFNGTGKNQQLYQTGFPLAAGTRYRLSFAARSTDGRDLQVFIHRHTSPYTSFGLGETVALNPGWNEVSLEFTAAGFSGTTADTRLRFWFAGLAQAGDIYDIDRVRLETLP